MAEAAVKIPLEAEQDFQTLEAELDSATPAPEPQQPAGDPPTRELLKPAVLMIAHTAAPNWRITPQECDLLAESYAAIIDKYFPGGISTWGPELNAVILTAAVIGPRLAAGTPPRIPDTDVASPKPNGAEASRSAEASAHP